MENWLFRELVGSPNAAINIDASRHLKCSTSCCEVLFGAKD